LGAHGSGHHGRIDRGDGPHIVGFAGHVCRMVQGGTAPQVGLNPRI